MSTAKLRMVAGPNGSGKSSLLNYLLKTYSLPLGFNLNPDEIEKQLVATGLLDFGVWGLQVDALDLQTFFREHPLTDPKTSTLPVVSKNKLAMVPVLAGGYFTAMLCDFLRRGWLRTGRSFTFETVMSGPDKIDFLRRAHERNYRTYLYYICTDDYRINEDRVASRVAQGGHRVPPEKIEPRYKRSLGLLRGAIQFSDRAYLFDNSGKEHRFIAEFESNKLIRISQDLPNWFVDSVLNKQAT